LLMRYKFTTTGERRNCRRPQHDDHVPHDHFRFLGTLPSMNTPGDMTLSIMVNG
jgi:hypothetical protein